MKKNLKKVISAVLALTLAMSSFVAMTTSAATFADVADTASYAEAVNALAALGAIAGTGDGTFKPDDNITRAEAATMIVAALNLSADAQNAGATSKFADVNAQAKWAVGYVNVGVAQNYISGTSATTFNPLDNVTYAQMLTMLTRILGYGDFAISRGGYPDGYVTSASIAGIVKGVAAGTEEPITRAQAAQLIWNAVQTPMLDIETFTGSIADTQLKKQDGTNGKWKTVLSDRFDAYVLDVTVEDTSIKNEDLDAGTITMKLEDIDQWDPAKKTLDTAAEYREKAKVAVGNTDAEDYVFSSAKVIAEYNSRGEWKLIYFAPTSKVVTKAVDGTLINTQSDANKGVAITPDGDGDGEIDGLKLYIKKTAGANQKNADDYELTTDAKLYVNGFEYMTIKDDAAKARKLIANSVGETVLVQKADSAKKIYDKVMVDVYALAKVSQVKADDDKTTVKLSSKPIIGGATWGDALTIEVTADQVEDGDKIVTVTKAGAAASLAALAKNDIIAIKFNLAKELDAADCKYIDIIASTDTATGVYTAKDTDTGVYTVGGVNYDVSGTSVSMTRGETYTMYLDPFGDIFAVDKVATSINYAIVESYYKKAVGGTDYDYMEVVTFDGQVKRLYIENDDTADVLDVLDGNADPAWDAKVAEVGSTGKYLAGSIDIDKRVISYKVKTSTGRVTSIAHVATTSSGSDVTYKASTNRLGTLTLSDTAVVLDATKYEVGESDTYKASALSSLVEDSDYTAFVVHQNETDKKWAYVVVLNAGTIYSSNSDFAVAANKEFDVDNATVVDEETVIKINVAGSDTPLYVAEDADVFVNTGSIVKKNLTQVEANTWLDEGAVFFYTTNADGFVDRIDVVVNGGYKDGVDELSTEEFNATIKLPATTGENKAILASDWKVATTFASGEKYSRIQLFYAPVVTASDRNVSFAALVEDGSSKKFNTNATFDFAIAEDANIYAYDLEDEGVDAFGEGAFYGINIAETDSDGYAWVNKADKYNFAGEVCYALVMAVDDVITNAVVFENVD